MLDSEQHFTGQGLELREAVFQAGRRRLRPILMTALATIFGMLPLALGVGAGAQMLQPLAIAGTPYKYMVVAFDEPAKKRFELNFVKAAMGAKNAYMTIYGVRVTDPKDYVARSKAFLSEHSGEIGKELEKAASPVMGSLPRREF